MNGTMKDSFVDGASGNQVKKMPTASKGLLGIVLQFIGETGTYIQNFFYKCIGTAIESVISAGIGESAGITGATVVKATFEAMRDATGQYIFQFKESIIAAVIGGSTGITSASVVKATFEELITESGAYNFAFNESLISASVGTSTGITSATAVKATFETQIDETSENSFVYNESTASASIGESAGITGATVDKSIFETLISVSGDTVFTFDGTDWKIGETVVDLDDYGIAVTGTAQANDSITITYVAEKWTLSDVEVDLEDYGISFEGTPNDGDTITISYTQSKWELNSTVVDLADYGITYVGTPEDGDTITINYTADNWYFEDGIVDIADYGLSVTGTPAYDDTIIVDYTAAYTAYSWLNIKVQEESVLVTKGVWTATGQTDFSSIPLPVSKGWAYFVNGSATINSVDYSSGDLIVFTKDVAEDSTITDEDFDLNDINIVTKDNTIIITNKTINADNNTILNLELDNFKTGVVKTTVRPSGEATDSGLPTEGAVRIELDKKQDTLGTASKTVEGKVRFGTGAEIVEGQSEIVTVSAKDLKDRGAEFQQLPFTLQTDVLSATAKLVTKNSKYFFYSNGDVSVDGKTIIKENTVTSGCVDIIATETHLFLSFATGIEVYSIGTDGTLTLYRTLNSLDGFAGGYKHYSYYSDTAIYEKMSYQNGTLIFPCRLIDDSFGFYSATDITVSGNLTFTPSDYPVAKVVWFDDNWVVAVRGPYVSYKIYYHTSLTTIFSAGTTKILDNGLPQNIEVIDGAIIFVVATSGYPTGNIPANGKWLSVTSLSSIPAEPAGGYLEKTMGGICSQKICLFKGTYYFVDVNVGKYATTESLESNAVLAVDGETPIVAYDIAVKGTTGVMTLNSDDIMGSGEVKIPILKSETTDLVTAVITIAKVVKNTVYKYGTIDSLTITAVEVSNRKSIIWFSTSASFTAFTPPTAQAFIGSGSVVAEKNYKIEIENGIMEVKEYSVPS